MRTIASVRTPDYHVILADYPGGTRQGWHRHDEAILTLNLAGQVREAVGGRETTVGPMHIGIKPAGISHTDAFGPEPLRALRIAFAPDPSHSADALVSFEAWTWFTSPGAIRALVRAAESLQHDPRHQTADEHIWDALSAINQPPARPPCGEPPAWLRVARERLFDDESASTLAVLAASAGVHRVHFAAQFRRYYASSVGECRQLRRAERAIALLRHTDMPLSRIAATLGYADQAHFTRSFGASVGIPPRRFRRLATDPLPFNRSRPPS